MPRDYAGRTRRNRTAAGSRAKPARNTRKRGAGGRTAGNRTRPAAGKAARGPIPGWVWMVCGVTLGLLAAMAAYITTRPVAPHMATVRQTLPKPLAASSPKPAKPPAPAKHKPRFAFYRMLPDYKVVIPKEKDRTPAQKAHPQVAHGGTYIIQVASFRDFKSANAEKAKLALLGIESQIQKARDAKGQTWYRVRVGPSQDTHRLDRVLSLLQQHHVDSLVMRVGQDG